jgi:large subunit ribosomal protein L29
MGIVELSDQDLVTKLHQTQRDLVAARFKHSTNQLENTASLRDLRRTIARLKSEAGRRETEQGLAKNALFAKFRPAEAASEDAPKASGGGFLQGIVDKISGDD